MYLRKTLQYNCKKTASQLIFLIFKVNWNLTKISRDDFNCSTVCQAGNEMWNTRRYEMLALNVQINEVLQGHFPKAQHFTHTLTVTVGSLLSTTFTGCCCQLSNIFRTLSKVN